MVSAVKMSDMCSLVLAQIPWRRHCSLIMYIIQSYSVAKCIPLSHCSATAFQHLIDSTKPWVYAVSRAQGCQIHCTKANKHFPDKIFPVKSGPNAILNAIIGLHVFGTYHFTSSCITFMNSTDVFCIYTLQNVLQTKSWLLSFYFSFYFFSLY